MKALIALLAAAALYAAAPQYPLRISASKRYLRDRAAKGFNTLMVNLVEHKFKGPKNRDGEDPFTVPGDFSKPNEKYFAHADWVIRQAGEYGIQVLLAPCYLGYKGLDEGWYDEVLANGAAKLRDYGAWVGTRYRNFDNILWLIGGDRDPGEALPHIRAMALAIKQVDPRHLHSAHCAPEHSAADCYAGESWLDVNSTYTYKIVHAMARRDYEHTPVMPFFLIESTYEGEHDSVPQWIRRQAYWAVLNGAGGQIMGNRPIWLFDPGWEQALDAPASRDMQRLHELFATVRWQDLMPDRDHRLVTGGWGDPDGLEYTAAARTADRTLAIVYLPITRTFAVNMAEMAGPSVSAVWFDPRTGIRKPGGVFPSTGEREFTTPPGGDSVLLLEAK